MRENLGQIESRGVALDFELAPQQLARPSTAAISTRMPPSSRGTPATTATGSPRSHAIWLRSTSAPSSPRLGTLSLQSRLSGRHVRRRRQHLSPCTATSASTPTPRTPSTSRLLGSQIDLFAAGENLTGQSIEVSKTPTTTLGQPQPPHRLQPPPRPCRPLTRIFGSRTSCYRTGSPAITKSLSANK